VRAAAALAAAAALVGTVGLVGLAVSAPPSASAQPSPALAGVVIPNLGAGYAVVSAGPLNAGQFASSSPDPAAAAGALRTLSRSITTYERVWEDNGRTNEVQDLVFRFATVSAARTFLSAAQHSLASGEIVSSAPLPAIPGARRTTYFATTTQVGVGQAISMRTGVYVALLSYFSSSGATNLQPISPGDAQTIAVAQHAALVNASRPAAPASRRSSNAHSSLGWAALIVAGILIVLLLNVVVRYRRAQSLAPPVKPEP
jgi:hypothetical protein